MNPIIRFMLAGFLLIYSAVTVSAQEPPLERRLDINLSNASLDETLNKVMKETGVLFLYKNSEINIEGPFTISRNGITVAALLDEIISGRDVTYSASGNQIILKKKEVTTARPTDKFTHGTVTDASGLGVIGATVIIKGTSKATSTDLDGRFSIDADKGSLIDISIIGYKTATIKAEPGAHLNIVLEDDVTLLEEVVVVGYGTQKKINMTGSVEAVGGDKMEKMPMPSLSRGLQGLIPNLNIDMADGKPIRSSEYNVRGTTSIGEGGGSTLILIDGAPGDPDMLNPNDIESVTVLKDAASAAIYGARGPFGVVLITTKNPSEGKTSISYSGNVSFYQQTQSNDYIWDGYTYFTQFKEAYYAYNDYVTNPTGVNNAFPFTQGLEKYAAELKRRHDDPSLSKVDVDPTTGKYLYYGSTNWYDELYKKFNVGTEHSVNISGSTKKVGYYISGRFYGQDGIFKYNSDDFKTFNVRAKGHVQVFPWLKVANNFDFSNRTYNYPLTSIYEKGIWRNIADQGFPMAVMFNPDGTLTRHAAYTIGDFYTGNNKSVTKQFSLRNTTNLTATFLQNKLRFNVDFTYSFKRDQDKRVLYPVSFSDEPGVILTEGTNKLSLKNNETNYIGTNVYGEYEETFAQDHYFKAMLGFNYEYNTLTAHYAERNGILKPDNADFNLTNGDNAIITGGGKTWAIMGVFTRLNYIYRERYLVEINARYDGSSVFPKNSRFGMFPSISAGWRISKENWWNVSPKAMSEFKLRASYGELGNGQVPPYAYTQTIGTATSSRIINGTLPLYAQQPSLIPETLTWERSKTVNIGLDMAFLNNRLTTNLDLYQRNTEDMYTVGVIVPSVLGTSSPKGNYADLRTRGFEFSIEWKDRIEMVKPLDYSVRFVLSDSQAEVTRYNNPKGLIANTYYAGAKVGEIWGYTIEGLFQSEEEIARHADQSYMKTSQGQKTWLPGDMKYKDLDGNKKINDGKKTIDDPGDMSVIGNTTPRWRYGINLSGNWNGFFLTAMIQGVGKRDWYPSVECNAFWGMYNRPYNMLPTHVYENQWSETNPDGYFPRLRGYLATSTNGVLRMPNTRYLQNAAYVRLKNLSFGYEFPSAWLEKAKINKLSVYFSGQNLWTWSPIHKITKNIDPEVISGSDTEIASDKGDSNAYPMLKNFTLGVTIGF